MAASDHVDLDTFILLREIVHGIHASCLAYGKVGNDGYVDYVRGANIAGFKKVADAMLAYGVV
jgi:glutamate dehydrogenase (NADP+)